jgi:hypothetical protein
MSQHVAPVFRLWAIPCAIAISAFAVAACGSSETTTVVEKQTGPPTQTVTVEKPAPKSAPASNSAEVSASAAKGVPDLVGKRLDVAESDLDDAGISYKEIGGGSFGIVVRSNWEVCETDPAGGAKTAHRVKLIVDRPGTCG